MKKDIIECILSYIPYEDYTTDLKIFVLFCLLHKKIIDFHYTQLQEEEVNQFCKYASYLTIKSTNPEPLLRILNKNTLKRLELWTYGTPIMDLDTLDLYLSERQNPQYIKTDWVKILDLHNTYEKCTLIIQYPISFSDDHLNDGENRIKNLKLIIKTPIVSLLKYIGIKVDSDYLEHLSIDYHLLENDDDNISIQTEDSDTENQNLPMKQNQDTDIGDDSGSDDDDDNGSDDDSDSGDDGNNVDNNNEDSDDVGNNNEDSDDSGGNIVINNNDDNEEESDDEDDEENGHINEEEVLLYNTNDNKDQIIISSSNNNINDITEEKEEDANGEKYYIEESYEQFSIPNTEIHFLTQLKTWFFTNNKYQTVKIKFKKEYNYKLFDNLKIEKSLTMFNLGLLQCNPSPPILRMKQIEQYNIISSLDHIIKNKYHIIELITKEEMSHELFLWFKKNIKTLKTNILILGYIKKKYHRKTLQKFLMLNTYIKNVYLY
jgi:hypothetical protein